MKKQNKGITLIALVITIIILLILAGITINLTIGQQGILTRAQEAGRNYQEAAKKEDEDLAKFLEEADDIIAGIGGNGENDKYTEVDGIPVPKGFKHTEGTKETGFVIQDISGTKTNGNEYVWVPCSEDGTNGIKYDRYAFLSSQPEDGIDEASNSKKITYSSIRSTYFIEAMSSEELNSIKQYGGFYIGRYEIGIVGHDDNVVKGNSESLANWTGYTGGTAVVQKGKQVWNYITKDKAKEIAQEMYSNNDAVISKLCSSYAWDTTLKFIEANYPDYATNSTQGNYYGTTFEYTDLNGELKTKEKNSMVLVPTGQTTPVNNIYDMGGNVYEWTTEAYSDANKPSISCGGAYSNDTYVCPASFRASGYDAAVAFDMCAFRQTLYVGL